MVLLTQEHAQKRDTFFRYIFGNHEGYATICRRNHGEKTWYEEFFLWPIQASILADYVTTHAVTSDLWFCPHLFKSNRRLKENVQATPSAWSDLDFCMPDRLLVEPTVTIESSPGRYQALWIFEEEVAPQDAEDISKRIAYHHREDGADISGWDLTQLLRIPYTFNHKYEASGLLPQVQVKSSCQQVHST